MSLGHIMISAMEKIVFLMKFYDWPMFKSKKHHFSTWEHDFTIPTQSIHSFCRAGIWHKEDDVPCACMISSKNCWVPLVCPAKTPSQLTLILNANLEMSTWIWNRQETSASTFILCPASTNDNNKKDYKPWKARYNTAMIFTTCKSSNTSSQTIQIPESFKRISRKE